MVELHSASAKLLYCKCHLGFFCIEIPFCVTRGVFYCPRKSGWEPRCVGAAGQEWDVLWVPREGQWHWGASVLFFGSLWQTAELTSSSRGLGALLKSYRPSLNQQGFSDESRDLAESKISLFFPNKTQPIFKFKAPFDELTWIPHKEGDNLLN